MERVNRDGTLQNELLPSEKSAVLSLVLRYCEKNKLTYRIIEQPWQMAQLMVVKDT
ncbi:MAG: hypothetical protein RLZZ502_756 [Pseudomonadota bacterium]|jgi:hypothetical protein